MNNAEATMQRNTMEYRFLGASGFKVSVLGFGTGTFGGKGPLFRAWGNSDVDDAKRLVDICLDAGVNLFDTADVYSDGASEIILGAAIKGRRDDVILSTKITLRAGEGPNEVLGGSVQSQLEGEELKTFKQGEIWWEPRGTAHVVPRNASKKNERSCSCFLLENKGRRLRRQCVRFARGVKRDPRHGRPYDSDTAEDEVLGPMRIMDVVYLTGEVPALIEHPSSSVS
jgi:hypothetical protein